MPSIDPALKQMLVAVAVPLTVELIDEAIKLLHSLRRSGHVDPPWAVGVAIASMRGIAANPDNASDTDEERAERVRAAIAQQLRNAGGSATPGDVESLYEMALKTVRQQLGLGTQPAPE
jgi:hypothetical protein